MLSSLPRKSLMVFALYLLVAIIITFPAVTTLSTRLIGTQTGDSYEMVRHMWWFQHAARTGQDLIWQSMLGYPDGFSGMPFRSVPLQYGPNSLAGFVLPLPIAYNGYVLLTLALNGVAMFWLARYLLRTDLNVDSGIPAWIAGLVFMAFPVFQAHTAEGHAGLIVMWMVPLYLYALFRLVRAETLRWQWLLMAVVCFLLTPAGHMLQTIYVLIPVSGVFFLAQVMRRDWQAVWRVLLAGVIGSVLLLIYMLPVFLDAVNTPVYAETTGFVRFSTDLMGIVTPSFLHPVYGELLDYPRRVLGVNLVEGATYIGIAGGLLMVIAVLRYQAARWWLILAGLAWFLALGPILKIMDEPVRLAVDGYSGYLMLPIAPFQHLPGLNFARTPGRFTFTLALAAAMLAGYGAAFLWQRIGDSKTGWQWQMIPAVLLSALLLFDYQVHFPFPTVPAQIPQAVHDLRVRDDIRAVFNVPWQHLLGAKDALYLQTAHEKPLLAGQVSRVTPVNPAKLNILQDSLNPALLQAAGADVVIVHKQRAAEIDLLESLEATLREQGFAAAIYDDDRIAIYNTPDAADHDLPAVILPDAPEDDTLFITDRADLSLYVSQPVWMDVSAQAEADSRQIIISLDDTPLYRSRIDGQMPLRLSLPLLEPGYHRLQFALESPCPQYHDPALVCRSLQLTDLSVTASMQEPLSGSLSFADGIHLAALSEATQESGRFRLRFWWQFESARAETDIRFVHILNDEGENVAQDDTAPGVYPADSTWSDVVDLDISQLPPGTYSVRVGWYDYLDDLTRFPVLTGDLPGAQDAAPEVLQVLLEN